MAGSLGLPLARDAATFYVLFALMSLSAYGVVAHRDDAEARRAGRAYIVFAIVGDVGFQMTIQELGLLAKLQLPLPHLLGLLHQEVGSAQALGRPGLLGERRPQERRLGDECRSRRPPDQ